jgi:hypothetical protein
MKIKLAAVLSALVLLTGCGLGGSDQAIKDLEKACEVVNAREPYDEKYLSKALPFFASAARADIKYLPLAHAAQMAQISVVGAKDGPLTEIFKSMTMILAYCEQ